MDVPKKWSWILLFTTSGTLLCCAIPIALVSLGFGAVVASMASTAPWLITVSQYKGWMFAASATLIVASGWAVHRSGRSCPADPELAQLCERANTWNQRFIVVSAAMWLLGFGAAYVLPRLSP